MLGICWKGGVTGLRQGDLKGCWQKKLRRENESVTEQEAIRQE